MAERVIYKCAENGTFYTTKDDNDKDMATINFNANDMDSLCNALNNWDLLENFEDDEEEEGKG
tara:strand:+ start:84 stop:272 length:189 start_codon:yes stop_codon:yes gene_type:complete